MKTCPNCQASISDTSKFCVKCGFNIKKYEEESVQNEYFCSECGTKFSGGTFCPECGFNVAVDLGAEAVRVDVAPELDLGTIGAMASQQLFEKEGFVVENGVLMGYRGNKRSIVIHDVEEIYDGAFENNKIVTFVEIKEGVKIIGKRAFANCKSLVKINIPASVDKLYNDTFDGVSLEEVIMPEIDKLLIDRLLSNLAKSFLEKNRLSVFTKKVKNGISVDINTIENKAREEKERIDKELASWDVGGNPVFGTYYIDNSGERKPLEWLVLCKQGFRALIITKNCIDLPSSSYNCQDVWDRTFICRWLNEEFFAQSFTDEEKKRVCKQSIFTPDEVKAKTGNYNVFLLDKRELDIYNKEGLDLSCTGTEYAKAKGITLDAFKHAYWWLRAEMNRDRYGITTKAYWAVAPDGKSFIDTSKGYSAYKIGIRPAIWVELDFLKEN